MSGRILFIRLDKIGDLICTLCSDDHPDLKEYSKDWLISKGLEFIPEHAVPKRRFATLTKNWEGFKDLFAYLKDHHFDASVSFQCPWWVHFLLFYFRIPIRVGVLSQWHSFLFLNAGIRQKRSQALHHEADYNFELVDTLAHKLKNDPSPRKPFSRKAPILQLEAGMNEILLHKWHLKPKSYFIVHPGMAGSSLNWPQDRYIDFIRSFHTAYPEIKIVMTGTIADSEYLDEILSRFEGQNFFLNLQGKLNSYELLSLLSSSQGILAPSTGVLHLAAALGIPTFGIFSPIKVQHPTRWAPRGKKTKTYMPPVKCPAHFECLKERCPHFNCMDQIDLFNDFKTEFEKALS
ncbi:MAG: glycosyltransferase family 9 protein [Bdellovibrionaceae bacterium]|nr:glycosyltransferase family 9 protein [Pseudobdellovibrionaceae bacterium]